MRLGKAVGLFFALGHSLVVLLAAVGFAAAKVSADFDGLKAVGGAIGALNDNFGVLGYLIIGVFALSWLASALIYRAKGYDALDVKTAA